MTESPATTENFETTERQLSAGLQMGPVTLRVGDLENMDSYYRQALGLQPLEEITRGREVHRVLGRSGVPLLRLIHTPNLPVAQRNEAGLFHTAFLFEDQASLAATTYRTSRDPRSQFAGSSDHLVSEAFYFTDPEGNGIELYYDKPRSQWRYRDGQVAMDTLFLDPNRYLHTHLTEQALADAPNLPAKVGHVHLQVGNIPLARDFYVETLGFAPTVATLPGALFASAGGYHHHVAMNTWNSKGAGPRAAQLGLANMDIQVPLRTDLDALIGRLQNAGIEYADSGQSVSATDPWGTQVTVSLPGENAQELLER